MELPLAGLDLQLRCHHRLDQAEVGQHDLLSFRSDVEAHQAIDVARHSAIAHPLTSNQLDRFPILEALWTEGRGGCVGKLMKLRSWPLESFTPYPEMS